MIWAIFSSSVIRARRSATRCSTGSDAFQYGASASGRSTRTASRCAQAGCATAPDNAMIPAPAANTAAFQRPCIVLSPPPRLDCAAIRDSATMMGGRGLVNRCAALVTLLLLLVLPAPVQAEDGYALWLRHAPLEGEALERLEGFGPQRFPSDLVWTQASPTLDAANRELIRGLAGLVGDRGWGSPNDSSRQIFLDC